MGGSSHTGKSTLAQSLATHLGWSYRSTDGLVPHPGRPWQTRPGKAKYVADHYLSLSVDELITDVLRHHKDVVWPLVKDIVTSHATDLSTDPLIFEGSAIQPELVATLPLDNTVAIWLTASDQLFEKRIYSTSQYETRTPIEKKVINKFLERSQRYNERMMQNAKRLGLAIINVENAENVEELTVMAQSELEKQKSVTRPIIE